MNKLAITVAASLTLLAPPALAQQAGSEPQQLTDVYACADIAGDAERLACFDGAVVRLREAQTAGSLVAVDRTQVATLERESFGFSLPSLSNLLPFAGNNGSAAELGEVTLTVDSVRVRGDGRAVFTMSDGQVWSQVSAQAARNIRAGDEVHIRRAAMGSFMLLGSRGGAGHRVHREN
jgi:hypothetical protein